MNLSTLTTLPETEAAFLIDGPSGQLESIFLKAKAASQRVAVLCHPHPLFEGSMHNKVVHTLSRAFQKRGIHSLRFNFRGVGKSEGVFDNSIGEVEDLLACIAWVKHQLPSAQIYLAGFSFGAYIAAVGASRIQCHQLFSIAPAVHHQPYNNLEPILCPWTVVQGDADEVVPVPEVFAWYKTASQRLGQQMDLIVMQQATHFFHARLIELRDHIEHAIQE